MRHAVKQVLKDGYRTIDIMDEGKTQVRDIYRMGDLICRTYLIEHKYTR